MIVDACDGDCLLDVWITDKDLCRACKGGFRQLTSFGCHGPVIQGELEITVPGEMTVSELNRLQSGITRISTEKIPELERLTINAVPCE
jgi:divalent metal cation (Fe/Co/Zn/Cd) transporter